MVSFERRGPLQHYKKIGIWLAENTAPLSTVAMVEIGTVGWYSGRHIIDILGLVTPHNAERITNRRFYDWFGEYQPQYLLRHEPTWGHEHSITALEDSGAYIPDPEFNFPDYVLLEKSPAFTDEMISKISEGKAMSMNFLSSLAYSSDAPPSLLALDNNRLFAHAPRALKTELEHPASYINVSYGIEKNATGLHHGICFNVFQSKVGTNTDERNLLISDCIQTGSMPSEMSRQADAEFAGNKGDLLTFEISCIDSCDYAWSYWDGVNFSKTPDRE